jgi:hypothetical protein
MAYLLTTVRALRIKTADRTFLEGVLFANCQRLQSSDGIEMAGRHGIALTFKQESKGDKCSRKLQKKQGNSTANGLDVCG